VNGKHAQNAQAMIACTWYTIGAPETASTLGSQVCLGPRARAARADDMTAGGGQGSVRHLQRLEVKRLPAHATAPRIRDSSRLAVQMPSSQQLVLFV
jgi:hypothetical protein